MMKSKPILPSKKRPEIDWEAIRRQVDEAGQRLQAGEELNPDALEQIWARRSAKLAQKLYEERQDETLPTVVIDLEGERYGLDARCVFDIRVLERITPVPRTPTWVLGVVNWRGRILSVIDLRRFWGLPSTGQKKKGQDVARLVVVQSGEMEVGIRVDEVFSVESIPVGKIQVDPGEARGIKPEWIRGIFLHAAADVQETVVLLNLPALLADPRLIVQEELL